MRIEILKQLNEAKRARRAAILVTDLATGEDRLALEGETLVGLSAEALNKAFLSGKSGLVEEEGKSFFLNVHVPPPRIVVIGAVHISQALAAMAPAAGFDLEIIDPRTAFATPERFAGVKLTADWPEDVLKDTPLDAFTALVAVTHDPKIDDYPLVSSLKTGCFYVGALGSRKTHAKRVERLKEAGCTDAQIARISAPIGLDIGASTPGEIAVAILGDIIQALRKRAIGARA
ncbi:MAG TPA: XdhC family protein [Ensifer sp.]|nr:XdhC family protein [Ensifer sp.]